jgi:CheY-like chemotaxis protein
MAFNCLILCDELTTLELVGRLMDEVGIERKISTDASDARKLIQEQKFEAILVDCDEIEGGTRFIKELRQVALNRYAIVFALLAGHRDLMQAYEMGANFVIPKPVTAELMLRCLRAAHGFMLREQRRAYRHPVDLFVTIRDEKRKQPPQYFAAQNLSEGGLGLERAAALKIGMPVSLHFQVPEIKHVVEGTAKIAWVGPDGRAGVTFTEIPRISQIKLREWLGEKFDQQASRMFPVAEDAGQRTMLDVPASRFENMVERVMQKHRL